MLAKVMSPFWTVFAATALSLAWLLPNHSIPWLGFHGDAWAAAMLAIVGAWVLWRNQFSADWHGLTLMMATTATIPLLQYAAGMIPLFGVAWINTVYVLGFLLALIVGAAWERQTPGQGSDYLLLAIGLASIASVGMQFNQILNLDSLGPWTMASTGGRHFANMAQPNQLASLLLLGVLACGWGFQRRVLWPRTATWIAAFLLFGVAMTGSRTGFLNVALLVVSTMIWRRVGPSPKFLQVVLGLGVFFVASAFLVPVLNDLFWDGASPFGRPASGDPRWTAWVMFMKAALHQPLLGFGWGQLAYAQFLMLDERIALGGSFLQAHNVILDLILWNGIPIGLAIAAFLAWWFWTMVRHINSFQQWVLLSFLMVLGVHAMLEYPLQYAYFLLPAGLVMGCLNATSGMAAVFAPRRWLNVLVLLLSVAALTITVRDYFRVETSFYGLRFELKKVKTAIPNKPPDVVALTQWRDHIAFARIEPRSGIPRQELNRMRALVTTMPSAFVMYRFAAMLALNDEPAEAQQWLRRICLVSPLEHCQAVEVEWAAQSAKDAHLAAVPWPKNLP